MPHERQVVSGKTRTNPTAVLSSRKVVAQERKRQLLQLPAIVACPADDEE